MLYKNWIHDKICLLKPESKLQDKEQVTVAWKRIDPEHVQAFCE